MRTISKSVKNKIEAFVINNKIKEAIIYAQSKGVTAEEFGKIAGKYWKLTDEKATPTQTN